jgi:hypothetical protein
MNWFGVVSNGVYLSGTISDAQRAAYAVSFGLLRDFPITIPPSISCYGLLFCGVHLTLS